MFNCRALAQSTYMILTISLIIALSQAGCLSMTNSQNTNLTPTKIPDIGDGGFLSDKPCGPPCFFEIIPGTTSKEQAITLLQSHELYLVCQEYDTRAEGGTRGINCGSVDVGLQKDLDIVESIAFQPSQTITVNQVFAKYGKPSAIGVATLGSIEPDEPVTIMLLLYDTLGVSLSLVKQNSAVFDVEPTTLIENIGYSDQNAYNIGRQYSQKWNGFGTYQESNP